MKMFFFLLPFLLILPSVKAQTEDSISFDFFDSNKKLFVIGEFHFENDGHLQLALVDYIKSNTSIDAFIFEVSPEVGKIFNDYVLHGNRENDLLVILSMYEKEVTCKLKLILDHIKKHNLANPQKIQVKGVDMYNYYKFSRQMTGLRIIFPELKTLNLPVAKNNIANEKVKNYSYGKTVYEINNLIKELSGHPEQYRQCLGNRLETYKEHLDQLKIYYANNHPRQWRILDSIRENILSENLIHIIDSNKVSLMICGANHALYKSNDDFIYGYPYTSMVANAKQKYPDEIYSIILQYYNQKNYKKVWQLHLLNEPFNTYFENNPSDYVIFTEEEIDHHPAAKERCDMVILKNTSKK